MDAELLQLARDGVLALQVGAAPNWAEIAAVVVSGVVGLLQCGMIAWGLRRWGQDTDKIRKQNERWREESREQTKVLADIGQGIRDQGMVLAKLLHPTP